MPAPNRRLEAADLLQGEGGELKLHRADEWRAEEDPLAAAIADTPAEERLRVRGRRRRWQDLEGAVPESETIPRNRPAGG